MNDLARPLVDYAAGAIAPVGAAGFDVDVPTAGFYRMRLVAGGISVAIRIWHGLPIDPATGEEMDRAPRWQAEMNGRPIDLDRVWPVCAKDPIDEVEARHLAALQDWGVEHGHEAIANPRRPLSPLHSPKMF